jgi:hypothetical protein
LETETSAPSVTPVVLASAWACLRASATAAGSALA